MQDDAAIEILNIMSDIGFNCKISIGHTGYGYFLEHRLVEGFNDIEELSNDVVINLTSKSSGYKSLEESLNSAIINSFKILDYLDLKNFIQDLNEIDESKYADVYFLMNIIGWDCDIDLDDEGFSYSLCHRLNQSCSTDGNMWSEGANISSRKELLSVLINDVIRLSGKLDFKPMLKGLLTETEEVNESLIIA